MGAKVAAVFLVTAIALCGVYFGWNAIKANLAVTIVANVFTTSTAQRPVPTTQRAGPRGERVAVVFYGIRLHAFDVIAKRGRKSAIEMAVEELDADVFVYGSSAFNAAAALRPMQHRIKSLYLGRQMPRQQLESLRDAGVDVAKVCCSARSVRSWRSVRCRS